MTTTNKMLSDAHEMGRERCDWLAEEQYKGGLPYYPNEWSTPERDIESSLFQLGLEFGSDGCDAVVAAVVAGFVERRDELQAGIFEVAQKMIESDVAAWRANGTLAGMADRARRVKFIPCEWTTRAIHDAGCLFYQPARWSYEKHIRSALIAAQ